MLTFPPHKEESVGGVRRNVWVSACGDYRIISTVMNHGELAVFVARVALSTPMEEFREVRFFRRGRHCETITIKRWFGLRKRQVGIEVYDDVVLFVARHDQASCMNG